MIRFIFIAAIVAVLYLLLQSRRRPPAAPPAKDLPAEDMVRCVHCGIHLPKHESVQVGEYFFCGTEHRDAYRR